MLLKRRRRATASPVPYLSVLKFSFQAFQEAVDAYTALIGCGSEPDTKELPALYGNRAAALAALSQFDAAIEGCTQALMHLTGDVLPPLTSRTPGGMRVPLH